MPTSRTTSASPPHTAANVHQRFAADGLEAALTERPRSGGPARLDGKAEAVVIALACSPVPGGRATWTARMLASILAVPVLYPDAEVIRVVLDNRNTHAFGSLFATFPPDEA